MHIFFELYKELDRCREEEETDTGLWGANLGPITKERKEPGTEQICAWKDPAGNGPNNFIRPFTIVGFANIRIATLAFSFRLLRA